MIDEHRTATAPEPRERLPSWASIALPALVMLAMGFWGLRDASMYGTEEATYWAAQLPWPSFVHLLGNVDAVHGVYYALIKAVFAISGPDATWMRLPSVLATAGTVALTALVAFRTTASTRVALFSALIMVSLPLVNAYAQAGRSYALDALGVMATTLVLLWAAGPAASSAASTGSGLGRPQQHNGAPSRYRWICYTALLTTTAYLHELTVLVAVCHGVTLVVTRAPRSVLSRWLASSATAFVLLMPLLVLSSHEQAQLSWIRAPNWADVAALVRSMLGPSPAAIGVLGVLIGVGALAPVRSRAGAHGQVSHAWRGISLPALALPLAVLPSILLLAESVLATPLYGGSRYLLYCESGLALLAAAGLDRLCRSVSTHGAFASGLVGLAVIVGLGVLQWPAQLRVRTPQGRPQDMTAAAAYVGAHKMRGDAILYYPRMYQQTPLGYPGAFRGVADIGVVNSPEQNGQFYGRPSAPVQVRRAMRSHARIWIVGQLPRRPHGSLATELAVLRAGYAPVSFQRYHGVSVWLYGRR